MTSSDLLRPWTGVLGDGAPSRAAGREVLGRYAEPHRRYHDARHLRELLAALDVLTGDGPVPETVVLAAYWHDAVYDPRAADNETRSAELAVEVLQRLGQPPERCREVARLVRVTAAHDPDPGDADGVLLSDADLSVLAASPGRYDAYAADVRAEYAHVPDLAFRAGRGELLRELLARPRLYAGEAAHRRWEASARRNVAAELSRLDGGADAAPPP